MIISADRKLIDLIGTFVNKDRKSSLPNVHSDRTSLDSTQWSITSKGKAKERISSYNVTEIDVYT